MKKPINIKSIKRKSDYIAVKQDGMDIIRVSNHLPDAKRLLNGSVTGKCKNVYLIFRKSMIDETTKDGAELAALIRLKESDNANERKLGEITLNNYIVEIGKKAKKGMNYRIIEGNSNDETKKAVNDVIKMLKTSAFVPLKFIDLAE